MTRDEVEELLPVLQAYAEGKAIQSESEGKWYDDDEMILDGNWNYRIKPELKYRPFKDAEECWQEMQKHQPFGWIRWKKEPRNYQSLVLVEKGGVGCVIDEISMKFKESFDILTFADGSVFGVKE